MTINLVQTEKNWNSRAGTPVTHDRTTFHLEPTGNRSIFGLRAENGSDTYIGHLNLVPTYDKKNPNVPIFEKFHITILSKNGKNVKANYFGTVERKGSGLAVVDAKTDGGDKQHKFNDLPQEIRGGIKLLLERDIFVGAVD